MTIPSLPEYVFPAKPVPVVTPFTYRDGVTMLKKLDGLSAYINKVLVPFVNDNFSDLANDFEEQVNILIAAVNAAIASIVNDSIEVQDPVVAGLINDEDSQTRVALDTLIDPINSAIEAINSTLAGRLSVASLDAAYASKATQTTVETGRLSQDSLDTNYAAKSVQDTVESGRLSQTNLDADYADKSVQTTVETGRLSPDAIEQTINDSVLIATAGVGVKVYRTTDQLIPATAEAAVIFTSEIFDTSNMHATNDTKLFVPDIGGAGFYMISGEIEWKEVPVGNQIRGLSIRKNGSEYISMTSNAITFAAFRQQVSTILYMAPGEYVELMAFNQENVARNIAPFVSENAAVGRHSFSLVKVNPSISDVDLEAMYAHFANLYTANTFTVSE